MRAMAVTRAAALLNSRGGPRRFCLQMQKARDNLQAILDAVIDLLQQQIFLVAPSPQVHVCNFKLVRSFRSRND
jgi:hypothetical protein